MTTQQTQPRTREELYERIRESSREEFMVGDMIRLGFWPAQGEMPHDPADEIRQRGELQRQLDELRTQNRKLYNEQALLKKLRKQRLLAAKQKQKETKERREQERNERAEKWQARKAQEIVYLGTEVSAGLNNFVCDETRLQKYGLPRFDNAAQIAVAMNITVNELRFLTFDRKTSSVNHYVRFKVPKKTGGERLISAPMPRLKKAQQWILTNILDKVGLHDAAHGFRHGHSIVSNAKPHVGAEVIINSDLKDFFPSINYKRVKGVFRQLGYSEAAATIFGLLCSEPEVEKVTLDGKNYFVAVGERHLPQGAPTSPAITNILCHRLDCRLQNMADEMGFVYTRYADDLTFSTSGESKKNICNVLQKTAAIVAHEGLEIHPAKTRVLRRARQQEVTGIVVNQKLSIDRRVLKRFRAVLFQIEKDGPEGKSWNSSVDVLASLNGFANYLLMVDPVKGGAYKQRVRALVEKHGLQKRFTPFRARPVEEEKTVVEDAKAPAKPEPKKWKLW